MNKENFIFFFRCDFTSRRRRQDRRNSHRSNHFFRGFDSPINTPSSPFLCQLTTTSVTGHWSQCRQSFQPWISFPCTSHARITKNKWSSRPL